MCSLNHSRGDWGCQCEAGWRSPSVPLPQVHCSLSGRNRSFLSRTVLCLKRHSVGTGRTMMAVGSALHNTHQLKSQLQTALWIVRTPSVAGARVAGAANTAPLCQTPPPYFRRPPTLCHLLTHSTRDTSFWSCLDHYRNMPRSRSLNQGMIGEGQLGICDSSDSSMTSSFTPCKWITLYSIVQASVHCARSCPDASRGGTQGGQGLPTPIHRWHHLGHHVGH